MRSVSSTRVLFFAVKTASRLFVPVFLTGGFWLVSLHALEFVAGQSFGYATEYLHRTGREDIAFIAILAIVELCFTLVWSAAWVLAVSEFADAIDTGRPANTAASLARHFNQVLIELVRSLASVLWRTPLLIVPAFEQYVRLAFIPFVVLFDPAYAKGKIDALKTSRALSARRFLLLAFVLALSLVIPWFAESLAQSDKGQWIWENPVGVLIGWLLTLLINTSTTLFLFGVFRGIYPSAAASPAPGPAGDPPVALA